MRQNQKETELLLRVMAAALHQDYGAPIGWDPACKPEDLADLILRQDLTRMVYPVIERQAGDGWAELRQRLKEPFARDVHRAVTQEYEVQALLDDMERDGIDCLPMKGWVMRDCYPDPLMRSMCDFDVLIRDMDSPRMRAWMEARGYTVDLYEDAFHDTYKKAPYTYIELHHCLIDKTDLTPPERAWVDGLMERIWDDKARAEGAQHRYRLSDEDFYVHHISHFYKHFTTSGAGIRFLADTWVYLQKKGAALDRAYLERQLAPLHLVGFARRMEQISRACLDAPGPLPEDAALVACYLTSEGHHGGTASQETLRVLGRGKGDYARDLKKATVWRVFLPMPVMRKRYPRLERSPWLLPAYWVIRAMRIVFCENYKFGKIHERQNREQYDAMKEIYRAAGVVEGEEAPSAR